MDVDESARQCCQQWGAELLPKRRHDAKFSFRERGDDFRARVQEKP